MLDEFDEVAIEKLKREGKKVALKITIKGKEDENTAVKAAELGADYIIINCLDWRVIPLENLIARICGKSKLIAEVENAARRSTGAGGARAGNRRCSVNSLQF